MKLATISRPSMLLLFLLSLLFTSPAICGEITVHNNKKLTVTGKTVTTNCDRITIASGSTLELNGSALLQEIKLSSAGTIIINSGSIQKCHSFYVIPRPDGKASIIAL